MRKIGLIGFGGIFLIGLCINNYVKASSPESWKEHRKEVISSCIQASGLRNTKATGKIISFGVDVGYDALLIEGNYPQPHMNNQSGKMLCLFNRGTRKANASPADEMMKK